MVLANSSSPAETIVLTDFATVSVVLLLVTVIVLTLGGNAITILAIAYNRQLKYSPYYLLLSLCVADFMVGLTVIPVSLAYHLTYKLTGKWIFGSATCDVFTCANLLFCSASVLNLCALSWDRYVAVTTPLRYHTRMQDTSVFKIIAFCWSYALIWSAIFTKLIKNSKNRQSCSIYGIDLEYSVSMVIVVYLIPVCFLVFVNGRVIKIALAQIRKIKSQAVPCIAMNQLDKEQFQQENTRSKKEMKTFRLFLIITVGVVLCWSPLQFVFVLDALLKVPGNVRYAALLMAYINSACNPFLYGIFSRDIRKSITKILRYNCS